MGIVPGEIGRVDDFINESERDATPSNDEGKVVKLESDGKISHRFLRDNNVLVYTSSDTYTKPDNLKALLVEIQAPGANGENCTFSTCIGTAGGSGAYTRKFILESDIGATEDIVLGSTSSFGSHCQATAGSGNSGGIASGGDLNINGESGRTSTTSNSVWRADSRARAFLGPTYGQGGLGRVRVTGSNLRSASSGRSGIVIITEYF